MANLRMSSNSPPPQNKLLGRRMFWSRWKRRRSIHRTFCSSVGQYIIALAKLAGVKTVNVVRREGTAEQVRQFGGDRVVIQGDNLHKDVEEALDGKKLSLVLDSVGG